MFNTNLIDRIPGRQRLDVNEVFALSDMPAPVADVITPTPGEIWSIKNPALDFGINSLDFSSGALCILTSDYPNAGITYSGTVPFITGLFSGLGGLRVENLTISLTNSTGICFDLEGGGAAFLNSQLNGPFGQNVSFGTIKNGVFFSRSSNYLFIEDAPSFENMTDTVIDGQRIITDSLPGRKIYSIGPGCKRTDVIQVVTDLSLGQTLFDISPGIVGPIEIDRAIDQGEGNYFSTPLSGDITAFADNTFGSVPITSVVDDGNGKARFQFSTLGSQEFWVGQIVDNSGFTVGGYDGDLTVIETDGINYWVADVPFISTDTGASDGLKIEVTLDAAHAGLVEEQWVAIRSPEKEYNNSFQIFDVSPTAFNISAFDDGTTTGSYRTSLDETDPRVVVYEAGKQKGSMFIGAAGFNTNPTQTIINTQNVFVDIAVGTAFELPTNERFTLTDTSTMEMRCEAPNLRSYQFSLNTTVISVGGFQKFELRLLINGAEAPDDNHTRIEVSSSPELQIVSTFDVELVAGDVVQLQVANTEGTSNIQFLSGKLTIK